MAQNVSPEPASGQPEETARVEENGTNRSNVMPISPEAARHLDAHDRRERADAIFRSGEYEGETLRMGQVLRRVREALALELGEISKSSLIRENFLMAIERMELQTIAKGYLVPYLIAYSKYLGLPEQEVVQRYTRECGAVDEVKSLAPVPKIGQLNKANNRLPLILAAGSLAVLLIGGGITAAVLMNQAPDETVSPAVVAVSGARESLFNEVKTAKTAASDLAIEVVAVRQGWLEVRAADGTIFLSRTLAAGENYFPRLKAGWTVSARNGGAFEWRAGDLVIGPLGPEGAQVFSVSVDDQIARAAELEAARLAALEAADAAENASTAR